MRIYFAGPLFCESELSFNQNLTRQLEEAGFDVFLPQRDGVESGKYPYAQMSPDERRKTMFETDLAEIIACDVFSLSWTVEFPTREPALSSAWRICIG